MNDLDLGRRLRALRRSVVMLETELRNGDLDEQLMTDIDGQVEMIALDPRCEELRTRVDILRESTLTPRSELMRDTVRACEKLRDTVDALTARWG